LTLHVLLKIVKLRLNVKTGELFFVEAEAGDTHLAAESADVLGVLGDLHLLDGLTKRSTITGSILACHSDLLGAFGL
jgi:hypothetical protein